MADRTYSEREVSDLISRAVERQQDASPRPPEVGLTLDEVERIGRETGIDPVHLRTAAAELDRRLVGSSATSAAHVEAERWIDTPLTPAGWEDIVTHVQDHLGLSAVDGGTIRQVGDAFEWRSTNGLGAQVKVLASPRGDRTRLRLSRLMAGAGSAQTEGRIGGAVIAVAITLMVVGVALFAGAPASAAVLAGLVAAVASWTVVRPLLTRVTEDGRALRQRQLDGLADEIAASLVRPDAPEAPATTPAPEISSANLGTPRPGPPVGRISADLLDDSTEARDVAPPRRVRE